MAVWPFPNGMNGLTQEHFQAKIKKFVIEEYMEGSILSYLMENASKRLAVIVQQDIISQGGGASIFTKLDSLDYKKVFTNEEQAVGIDRFQKTRTQTIPAVMKQDKITEINVSIQKFAAGLVITEGNTRRLAANIRNNRDFEAYYKATTGIYNHAVNGSMPVAARAVAGNTVDGNANDGVYAYSNQAVLAAQLLAAMPAARASSHKMSIDHINRCRMLASARIPVIGSVSPVSVSRLDGFEANNYFMLVPPIAAYNLRKDPHFEAQQSARGIQLTYQNNPVLGGMHVGRINGVTVIEVGMLGEPEFEIKAANGDPTDFVWSLFLGGGAWGYYVEHGFDIWEKENKEENYRELWARWHHGIDCLRFSNDAGNYVENGIIHSFTRK